MSQLCCKHKQLCSVIRKKYFLFNPSVIISNLVENSYAFKNMDTLEEIPVEKWHYLQEKLLIDWPRNFAGYHALKKNKQFPELRESFQFKVYCPYGDVNNGFIATSLRVSS